VDFASAIRRFESFRPSQPETIGKCGFLAFADFAQNAFGAIASAATQQHNGAPGKKLSVLSVKVGLGRKPRWYRGQKAMR
jgi:hypothetical protein